MKLDSRGRVVKKTDEPADNGRGGSAHGKFFRKKNDETPQSSSYVVQCQKKRRGDGQNNVDEQVKSPFHRRNGGQDTHGRHTQPEVQSRAPCYRTSLEDTMSPDMMMIAYLMQGIRGNVKYDVSFFSMEQDFIGIVNDLKDARARIDAAFKKEPVDPRLSGLKAEMTDAERLTYKKFHLWAKYRGILTKCSDELSSALEYFWAMIQKNESRP